MIYVVSMTIIIQKTTGVKLVVLRNTAESESDEDASDTFGEEESEEIDLLMDLIENESKDRDPPPVTTVRLIKQVVEHKPMSEQIAQHSVRHSERLASLPHSFKEYHIHYHNHQHKGPSKPMMALADGLHPFVWNSQFSLGDADAIKQLQKSALVPYHKVKNYAEFDSFWKNNLRSQFPSSMEKVDPKIRQEAFRDFETFVKPRLPIYKSKEEPTFERFKKFQEFYDSEEEKMVIPNKNRFAGFKDFSELENQEKSKVEEYRNEENPSKKTVKIKDFAIVIKSRPRKIQKIVHENVEEEEGEEEDENSGPQIPALVNKLNIPRDKIFTVPKIIDAAGGTPKYIEALNQLRNPQREMLNLPMPFPFNVNALEHERRKHLHPRPPFLPPPPLPPPMHHPMPLYPRRPHINGWLMRRLMKT